MRQICSIAICLAILFITPYAYPGDKKTTGTGYWIGNQYHYEETTEDDSIDWKSMPNPNWDYLNRQSALRDNREKTTIQSNAQIKQTIIEAIIEGKITAEDGKKLYESSTGQRW